jgi:hypothetical protein
MSLPVQILDLSNLVNASTAILLSDRITSLIDVPVTSPSNNPNKPLSAVVFLPVYHLSAATFSTAASGIVNVSNGYLNLVSAGTASLTATSSGFNAVSSQVCLSATATITVDVNNVYVNSQWFNL